MGMWKRRGLDPFSLCLSSTAKLLAEDTWHVFIYSNSWYQMTSRTELNYDLMVRKNWVFQWNMSFNPDSSKQIQEVICSRKTNKVYHSPLNFNISTVTQATSQKCVSVIVDSRLTFNGHLNSVLIKTNKAIRLLCKLLNILPKPALITT